MANPKTLKLKTENSKDYQSAYKTPYGSDLEFLHPISKINIFVGSNNSGKSRFARMLSNKNEYFFLPQPLQVGRTLVEITRSIGAVVQAFHQHRIDSYKGITLERLDNLFSYFNKKSGFSEDEYLKVKQEIINWSNFSASDGLEESQVASINQVINDAATFIVRILDDIENIKLEKIELGRVYIPSIRGLRSFDSNHTDIYEQRTREDYFSGLTAPDIFTGLNLYARIKNLLLGNNPERQLISKYQKFLGETLFEGKEVALIPNEKAGTVIVKIGNEQEQPIHNLGDGIQSAIILSFLPFITQKPTAFFIEEPEMFLHPGLQRKLLQFFNSRDKHLFFLTTHSNHFLDITIDIPDVSIFTFRKVLGEDGDDLKPDFVVEAVDKGHQSSLELLGVRNSSVFLVNATVWVEGITDRWYLREMLKSYMNCLEKNKNLPLKLEEDSHYCFVEYGGANITHFSFLDKEEHPIEVERLCARAVVIIDQDGVTKMQRKEELEAELGERLIILPCREVENLLPYEIIKSVVAKYEGIEQADLPAITYNLYKDEYLGTFIESKILKGILKRKGGYKSESGTIKAKVDFCKKALPKISFETLPDSTKEIIEKLYQFILSQNS